MYNNIHDDFCKYVDVFLGNGETDRFFEDGLASKWFYIKALCGNTAPYATLPFCKMSVGAYSGGYPTGYGTHYPNSCGGIRKLDSVHRIKGFSHLHQSGTGAIRYYYNYAITSPFYGDINGAFEPRELKNEKAQPGYYSATVKGVSCELTVDGGVALHRYAFSEDSGRVAIDFSNIGLSKIFGGNYFSEVKNPDVRILSGSEVAFSGEFYGVTLHFFVKAECKSLKATAFENGKEKNISAFRPQTAPYGVVFDFSGKEFLLRVGYSTVSIERAKSETLSSSAGFDAVVEKAYSIWNERLSAFQIETENEELKQKFYSNLYHSLLKPADMSGECVLGVCDEVVTDLATLWDQYKTALPLIYMCYPDMGEKIAKGIVNISRSLNKIPCSFGLSDVFPCEEQAKMLGVLSLLDAYYMGINGADASAIEECVERELSREDYSAFIEKGYFERYTHILDVTDACLSVAEITKKETLKNKILKLSENWKNAYAEDGIMSSDSKYYEGDRYTYSFRIQKNMEERVELFGGKEAFAGALDSFFGFNGESIKPMRHLDAYKDIAATSHHRFEGFNNECDMEAPYAYIYADRHDRLAEIMQECVSRSFGTGRGGLPGNNDSGGLSSLFVFNSLGIFPVSGSGEFLIGSPAIDGAKITLSSGKVLVIRVKRETENAIYVKRVLWNRSEISSYKIPVTELMQGGILEFCIK